MPEQPRATAPHVAVEPAKREASVAAAQVTIRRFNLSTHMRGWEAFGTAGDEPPDVRELGTVTFAQRGEIVMRLHDDAEDWPPAETTNGVAVINVATYGDQPDGAFISVAGPDRDAVEAAWHRARATFLAAAAGLWEVPCPD